MEEVAVESVGLGSGVIVTIVVAFIGVLKGGDIWKFFTEWMKHRKDQKVIDLETEHLQKQIADLEFDIAELKGEVAQSVMDKKSLHSEITVLKIRVAVLKERLENYIIQSRGNTRRRKIEDKE